MYRALVSRNTTQGLRLRRADMLVRHNASSSASESAQQKASAALGSAQKGAEHALGTLKSVSGKVGEKAGEMLGGYRKPLLYNLSVAREFLKQVYVRESLAPPSSIAEFTSTYQTLFSRARDASYWRGIAKSGELTKVGIYGLEAYFVFHIGEMIGRRSIVGYKVDA